MQITSYLFVSKAGNVRVNARGTGVKPNELRLKLRLNIPDLFFTRPEPVIDITFPEGVAMSLTPEAAVAVTAQEVARALGLDVEDVQDGLMEAMARKLVTNAEESTQVEPGPDYIADKIFPRDPMTDVTMMYAGLEQLHVEKSFYRDEAQRRASIPPLDTGEDWDREQ